MQDQGSFSKKHLCMLILIIIASMVAKLAVFFLFYHDPSQVIRHDSNGYLIPAKFLVTAGHYWVAPNKFMFFRTPGYPVLIAIMFYFFNFHLQSVIVAQILLSIISIVCFFIVGTRLFSSAVGLLAAFFVGFGYLLWSYNYVVMTDSLFSIVLSAVVLFAVLALTGKKYFYLNLFLLGFFIALAALVRPIGYFLIFPMAVGFLVYMLVCRYSFKKVVLGIFFLFIPFVIIVGGWQVRNKVTLNTFKFSGITSQAGIRIFFPENFRQYIMKHKVPETGHSLGIIKDVMIVLSDPKTTLTTATKGLERLMIGIDEVMPSFLGYQGDMPQIRQIKEAMFHFNLKKLRTIDYHKLHAFSLAYFFGALLINLLFYFFIAVGLVIAAKKGFLTRTKGVLFSHLLLLGLVLYFVMFSSNAAGYARFRVAFQGVIDFYAAAGLVLLLGLFCRKRK